MKNGGQAKQATAEQHPCTLEKTGCCSVFLYAANVAIFITTTNTLKTKRHENLQRNKQ
jgi:hypothetical protein